MTEPQHAPQTRRIARSSLGVGGITMISRILGLARDKGLVLLFGASPWILDAFLFAFTIPNLFRRVFGEGAVSAAFIPAFVHEHETQGRASAGNLANSAFTLLFLTTGAITLVGIGVCLGLTPFFKSEIQLTLELLIIMMPFLTLVCCAALLSAIQQGIRSFLLPAAMSVLLNIAMLAAFVAILWKHMPPHEANTPLWQIVSSIPTHLQDKAPQLIQWVAWAVVASGLVQVVVQWAALSAQGVSITPCFRFRSDTMRAVLMALGPVALGLGVVQINVLLDNAIAYWLSTGRAPGATTYLYLGNRLMQLPLGVFGVALATTAFPFLAAHAAKNEIRPMMECLADSVRMLLFIVLPCSTGLIVMADPIMRMLYQEADLTFSHAAVYRSAAVLALYSAGLGFFCIQQLMTRVFYARKDFTTPVKVSAGMVAINLVLNLTFIHMPDFYRRWARITIEGMSDTMPLNEAGLALSTTISAAIGTLLLWSTLRKSLTPAMSELEIKEILSPLVKGVGRILAASVGMAVFVYFVRNSIPWEPELPMRLMRGLMPIAAGALAYLILCWVVPLPELGEFLLRRRKK